MKAIGMTMIWGAMTAGCCVGARSAVSRGSSAVPPATGATRTSATASVFGLWRPPPPLDSEESELWHSGARGEDAAIVRRGFISVTPLRLDWTATEELSRLNRLRLHGFESVRAKGDGWGDES